MLFGNVNNTMLFSVVSLVYMAFFGTSFFIKRKIKSTELNIFKKLIIVNIISLVIEITLVILMLINSPILNIVLKIFNVCLFSYVWLFGLYSYCIINRKNKIKQKSVLYIIYVAYYFICSIVMLILPVLLNNENFKQYSYGPSVNLLFVAIAIIVTITIFMIIMNFKNVKKIKCIPIMFFILFIGLNAIIQYIYPHILLANSFFSFITFMMYFTIENPDLKMIDELYKNKILVEKTYEDKSNFLFEMTQEVREPLFKINNLCKEIDKEENKETIKEGVKLINASVKQLDFIVNDVLDVTSLDVQKVRSIESNYNINNLYEDIVTRMNGIVPKNIEFRYSIISTSKYLYGDNIKLKQIITSILMNSIKKTEKGYIEFSIDTIERYDVVRLVVKIIDSGSGMTIDKINDILEATGELSPTDIENMEKMELNLQLCQKIIKLLGGNLMIKSGEEKGTEVILTIDQKVKQSEEASVLNKYENYLNRTDSILIVSQNKKLVSDIEEKFKGREITLTTSLFGKDAIDKVRSGKKYRLILMDDEMKDINGYTTFKELEKIEGFKTPVVIMLDHLKDKIKEQYISDGFDSYLLIENFNEEIEKIINKYVI